MAIGPPAAHTHMPTRASARSNGQLPTPRNPRRVCRGPERPNREPRGEGRGPPRTGPGALPGTGQVAATTVASATASSPHPLVACGMCRIIGSRSRGLVRRRLVPRAAPARRNHGGGLVSTTIRACRHALQRCTIAGDAAPHFLQDPTSPHGQPFHGRLISHAENTAHGLTLTT